MPRMSPDDVIRLYENAKTIRAVHENDWRKAAAYCLPAHYSAWQTDGPATYHNSNEAARRIAFDTTGARSLPKFAAVLERMATPQGQRWHGLRPSDENLQSQRRVRQYFDDLERLMFRYRYDPRARFRISTSEVYTSLGVYGNGPIYVGERRKTLLNPTPGFKYVACPMRDIYFLTDDEGEIQIVFRRFWLNVRQFAHKFPGVPMPSQMESEAKKAAPDETRYFEFIHFVCARDEDTYDPGALDARRHPVCGQYLCIKSREYVGDETGYQSMPYKIPRAATVSGDPYGYSPAVTALAALGGASEMKKTNLKQGQKAVDPPLLAHDDGVMNGEVDLRPGAVNYGGVDRQGRTLIQPLVSGNFRVGEVLLQDERADIEDTFLVALFQRIEQTPEMTATEVMERVAEQAALLAPTMGRLQSEFLGPTIEREIDLLAEMGVMPDMPPELVEAQGEYEVVYTSPLAKTMYAEEVSGFMRSVELALQIAGATQDLSSLDIFDFDSALPEIADHLAVPARWMSDPNAVQDKREARSQQAMEAEMMRNAPALASAAKTAAEVGQQ